MSVVDWSDPECPISSYFTVKEALWLPSWKRLAAVGDGLNDDAYAALLSIFQKMDVIRELLDRPIHVHVAYRPSAYNREVGGAAQSCHMARKENGTLLAAVDWDAASLGEDLGESCHNVRLQVIPKLEAWGLRLEDNGPRAPWLHIDSKPVPSGGSRFFKP